MDAGDLRSTKYTVHDDGVAQIMLSRPARRNAWTGRMHTEYRWCCAAAEADHRVRAIVVCGDPEGRAFCVGADSDALAGHVERGGYDDGLRGELPRPGSNPNPYLDAHFAWQLGLRVPLIAAVNGACAGVALAVVAFADLRFADRDATFATAAPKLGLPAEYGLSWMLPRTMNRMAAVDVLLSGRRFSGAEAASHGFVIACDGPEETVAAAMQYARVLARDAAPTSVAMAKRQLADDLLRHDVGASVREADALLAEAMRGPDFAEGVAALRQRRAPRWGEHP